MKLITTIFLLEVGARRAYIVSCTEIMMTKKLEVIRQDCKNMLSACHYNCVVTAHMEQSRKFLTVDTQSLYLDYNDHQGAQLYKKEEVEENVDCCGECKLTFYM